jgi:hypothetical protein
MNTSIIRVIATFLLLNFNHLSSQTSVGLFVGNDVQFLKFFVTVGQVQNFRASPNSVCMGGTLEHALSKHFGVQYSLDFASTKRVNVPISGYALFYTDLHFKQARNTLELKYYAHKYIHFGMGAAHTHWVSGGSWLGLNRENRQIRNHWAVSTTTRLKYKPIFLDFTYGQWFPNESFRGGGFRIEHNQFLTIKVGYNLLLFKKREKQRVRCPKF